MSDVKFSALPADTTPADAVEFGINDAGTSRKVTRDNLLDGVTVHSWLGAEAWTPTITTGCSSIATREIGANNQNVNYLAFPDGADSKAFYNMVLPQNWDALTIKVKVYWTTELPSATTETAELEIAAVSYGDSDPLGGTAFPTGVASTDTWLANDDMHIMAQSAAVTITNAAVGEYIGFVLTRDISGDTLQGDIQFLGATLEYTITKTASVG